MFCQNCGDEVAGKFCSNCGFSLVEVNDKKDVNNEPIEQDSFIVVNETEVNISEIIRKSGKNKIEAIKTLRNLTGVGLVEGKNIVDESYLKFYEPDTRSFGEKFKKQVLIEAEKQRMKSQEQTELKHRIKQEEKERIKLMDREGTVYCPKCKSTSISSNKKGFGIGKAIIGGTIVGPLGLIGGNINAKKVRVTCLKCGYEFWAGKR